MAGYLRRVFSVTLLATLLAVTGLAAGVSVANAAARPVMAGSSPGDPPGGHVGVLGEHFNGYCVKNYKPNSTVKVVNELTGATVLIHTNGKGNGCANVPVKRACHAVSQKIVASGIGNDGNPATTSATIRVPATASLCTSASNSGGVLPFTGSNIIIPGVIIGLVLIAVGAVMNIRRRRSPAA